VLGCHCWALLLLLLGASWGCQQRGAGARAHPAAPHPRTPAPQVRLRHIQLPEEARDLDKELRAVTKEKDAAVRCALQRSAAQRSARPAQRPAGAEATGAGWPAVRSSLASACQPRRRWRCSLTSPRLAPLALQGPGL
jgi:hypothetical protein